MVAGLPVVGKSPRTSGTCTALEACRHATTSDRDLAPEHFPPVISANRPARTPTGSIPAGIAAAPGGLPRRASTAGLYVTPAPPELAPGGLRRAFTAGQSGGRGHTCPRAATVAPDNRRRRPTVLQGGWMNFFSKRRRAPAPSTEHSPPAVREASEPETPPVAAEPAGELPPPP